MPQSGIGVSHGVTWLALVATAEWFPKWLQQLHSHQQCVTAPVIQLPCQLLAISYFLFLAF